MRYSRFVVLLVVVMSSFAASAGHAATGAKPDHDSMRRWLLSETPRDASAFSVDKGTVTVDRTPPDEASALAQARSHLGERAPLADVLGTAARLRMGGHFGRDIPNPQPVRTDAATSSTPPNRYAYRSVVPAGDLDGDGVGDVMTSDFVEEFGDPYRVVESRIAGVRGSDGSVLWERTIDDPYSDFAVPLGVDITGDGRADLIRLTVTATSLLPAGDVCTIGLCLEDDSVQSNVEVLDGLTLKVNWSKEIAGSNVVVGSGALLAFAFHETRDAVIEWTLAGDQNDDGLPDLIIKAYDVENNDAGAFAGIFVGAIAEIEDAQTALRADVVSGRNGAVLFTKIREMKRGSADLVPAGTMTADSTPDLVLLDVTSTPEVSHCEAVLVAFICLDHRLAQTAVDLIDGRTGAVVWTGSVQRIGDDGFLVADAVHDLNGDGVDDILLLAHATFPFSPTQLLMLDGVSGERRWARTFDQYLDIDLRVIGPTGGRPGDDLAEVSIGIDSADNLTFTTVRADGATGQNVRTSSHTITPPKDSYLYGIVTLASFDGDQTKDMVFSIAIDDGTNAVNRTLIESGKSAQTIFDETRPGFGFSFSGGEADGDGRDDLLNIVDDYYAHQVIRLSGYLTRIGDWTWTRADGYPVNISGSYDLLAVPDIDGDGGVDIVLLRSIYDNVGSRERYDAVSGMSGSTLWGHGDTIDATPGGYASIGGTIRNADAQAVPNICVILQDGNDGGFVDEARTDPDGRFLFDHIGLGPFKVEFTCGSPDYETQWYDNKRSFAGATPITLSGGEHLEISVVLSAPGIPINDDAIDAIPVASRPTFWDTRDTTLATTQAGEPTCAGTHTIWYRLTTTILDGAFLIQANGGYSTGVAVYKGEDPFTATRVACGLGVAQALVPQDIGYTTYWIQVGSLSGEGGQVTVGVRSANPI